MADPLGFNQALTSAAEFDLFTGVLPFIISYTIFFILLNRVPLFDSSLDDSRQRKFSALISIGLALYVSYFLATNAAYQMFFSAFFGRIIIGVMGLIGLMLLLATIGIDLENVQVPLLITIISIMAISAFSLSGGTAAFLPDFLLNFEAGGSGGSAVEYLLESGLIWVIVIAAALFWVSTERDDDGSRDPLWWVRPPGGDGDQNP